MRAHYGALAAIVLSGALTASSVAAQTAPPGTDIFLAELTLHEGRLSVEAPANITRRAGYDNQPGFAPDGRSLYFTSVRADGQADIYRYDLADGAIARFTHTTESEYSPTVTPDGAALSVVRVEADSTQRLWRFPLDGGEPGVILDDVAPVGYHAWGDGRTLALFVLGSPPTLRLADTGAGTADVLAENIGRSLHRVPKRHAISFVQKLSDDEAWITVLDLERRESRRIARTLGEGEDYAWLPDGTLLMGRGSSLYRWNQADGGEWREVADLTAAGVRGITRLAVSPAGDRLALVAEDGG